MSSEGDAASSSIGMKEPSVRSVLTMCRRLPLLSADSGLVLLPRIPVPDVGDLNACACDVDEDDELEAATAL